MTKTMKCFLIVLGLASVISVLIGIIGMSTYGQTSLMVGFWEAGLIGMAITSFMVGVGCIQSACKAHRQAQAAERIAVHTSTLLDSLGVLTTELMKMHAVAPPQTEPLKAVVVQEGQLIAQHVAQEAVPLIDENAAQEAPLIEKPKLVTLKIP